MTRRTRATSSSLLSVVIGEVVVSCLNARSLLIVVTGSRISNRLTLCCGKSTYVTSRIFSLSITDHIFCQIEMVMPTRLIANVFDKRQNNHAKVNRNVGKKGTQILLVQ